MCRDWDNMDLFLKEKKGLNLIEISVDFIKVNYSR